ncbi:unnamed protein product, partial [Candidula unifasciata]
LCSRSGILRFVDVEITIQQQNQTDSSVTAWMVNQRIDSTNPWIGTLDRNKLIRGEMLRHL